MTSQFPSSLMNAILLLLLEAHGVERGTAQDLIRVRGYRVGEHMPTGPEFVDLFDELKEAGS